MHDQPARDQVCGMKVQPEKAAATVEYEGKTYSFCGKGCAAKFQADPEAYLDAKSKPAPAAPPGRISSSRSFTTRWACRLRRGCSIRFSESCSRP